MNEFMIEDVNGLKNQLAGVINYLDEFEDNHSKNPGNLSRMMSDIKIVRENMLKKYKKEELEKFNQELDFYIKQIAEKFDNMIEQKSSERDQIAVKLQDFVNRKKIAKYQR